MKRLIPFFFILILGTLVACQQKKADPEQIQLDSLREDSATLKIGYLPTLESLPLLTAEQLGYFDSAKIKLVEFDAAMDLDTAILNNRVQCITSDLCRAQLLNHENPDIQIIAKTQELYQLITAHKQRIRQPKNLENRLIAIARNEMTDYLLDQMLKHAGMNPDIVNRPQINSIPLRKKMILYEELDGALLPEPQATECIQNGDHSLMSNADLDEELGCLVINRQATANFLEQMNKVAHAYNQAVSYLEKNKPDLTTLYDISKEVADTLSLPHYEPLSLPREKDIDNAANWLKSRKLLPQSYQSDHLLSERFLNK